MSDSKLYYMKETVYFEPLFNHWYAWPLLLAPVQGARYISQTHLRLMKSFVKNYELHMIASKQLAGGEFLHCTGDQIGDISRLIDSTENEQQDLIKLSRAIDELDDLLRSHKVGDAIESLYEKIPSSLKGYVELFVDLEHHPSYRIIESLIYRSDYYKKDLQSVSFGLTTRVNERPFVLSTPRLADSNHLQVNFDFNSPSLKALLATRDTPLTMPKIDELFADRECVGGLHYRELFTTDNPRFNSEPIKNSMRVRYSGHAGFIIETSEISILIDPVIASKDKESGLKMINFGHLPSHIDFICLTHTHQDHTQIETLLQLRHKTDRILVPKNNGGSLNDPSLKLLLQQLEFNVIEFEDMESICIPDGKITAIPFLGEHGDLNIRSKTAWLIEYSEKKLFFGADSACLDRNMYLNVHKAIGNLDMLAIGMECVGAPYTWLYGALHSKKPSSAIKESRRLNGSNSTQAKTIIDIFKPKQVYIYALGIESCYKYFMGIEYDKNSKQIIESDKILSFYEQDDLVVEKLVGSREIEI